MEKEIRQPRSYKIRETPYRKAADKAIKNGTTLAELVELWVTNYIKPSAKNKKSQS